MYVLILTAILLYAGCITLQVFNFIWFDGCTSNTLVNVVNSILIVLIAVVQMMGYNPNGSLITSGAQSIYMTYLIFSA